MGSLLPLSSSSSGRTWPLRPIFLERSMEKTAAASVDETIAPSNNDSRNVKPNRYEEKTPTNIAVTSTPTVESATAFFTIGFTLSHFVSKPPENKSARHVRISCRQSRAQGYF